MYILFSGKFKKDILVKNKYKSKKINVIITKLCMISNNATKMVGIFRNSLFKHLKKS